MSTCVIVIPVYKANPERSEIASFRQCLTVLSDYEITLVTFEDLDLSTYDKISRQLNKTYKVEYFDKNYFKSVDGYNKLCLSPSFYDRFLRFEYMLIYQLDAWVFSNQLQYWCEKGYDYIGSPFFKNSAPKGSTPIYNKKMVGVGNGGFSLRRIQYCKRLLERPKWAPYLKPSYLWKLHLTEEYSLRNKSNAYSLILSFCKTFIKSSGYRNSLGSILKLGKLNEDFYFSEWALHAWGVKANLPSYNEASLFAFEVNPSYLYSLTKGLPFGCHAFEKWEFDKFWYKYIRC
ncbi:DUF5672 family protein [Mangrovibacterium marinum]|uniref:DUF5672 family protein n=1 Tax=Mangrovibacterium marinum TaxID=1639118 RepID=UPI002A18DFB6|nr:DUF5672 family protein [Mangrovibacterium marinum]